MSVEGHATDRGKPDPNIKPPPAVARAAARSEELANQVKAAKEAAANTSSNTPPNTPGSEPPKPPELPLFQSTATRAPIQPPPMPAPEPPQPPQPSPADFEHQFKSLKGRYDRAEEDNRRMAAQISDMQRLFATLQTAPPPSSPQASQPGQEGSGVRFSGPITGRRYIQPKEEQEYGAELLDVMGRRTMEVVEPAIGQLQAELAGIKRQLGGVQRAVVYSDQEKMYQQLKEQVPNWDVVNEHPEFHNWLRKTDPMSGRIRQELLSEAWGRNEAERVSHAFKAFLIENGYAPSTPTNGNGAAPSAPTSPTMDIAQYAAPGRPKPGGVSPSNPDKPVFSGTQIKQFYADSAAGKYKGREDDYNAIQQAIFAAMRENRIRN